MFEINLNNIKCDWALKKTSKIKQKSYNMKKFSTGIKLSKLQKILFFKNFMIPQTKIKFVYF